MVVERGGLRYPIEVVDRFSEPLLKFRDDIAAARASWREWRSEIGGTASEVSQITASMKAVAAATKQTASATQAATKAHSEAKAELTLEQRGAQALKRELDRLAVAEEADRQAAEQGIQTRRQLTAERRAAAEQAKAEAAAVREAVKARKAEEAANKATLDRIRANASAQAKAEAESAREAEKARKAQEAVNKSTLDRIRANAAAQAQALEQERLAAEKSAVEKAKADALDKKLHDAAVARIKERLRLEDAGRVRDNVERQKFVENYRLQLRAAQQRESGAAEATAARELDQRARALQGVLDYQERLRKAHIAERKERAAASAAAQKASERASRDLQRETFFANNLLFTFRRLVGVLAIFQAARVATGLFTGLLSGGIAFNQTLEQSRLGLAGILTSIGEIKDIQTGELLQGAEKYAAAQRVAADQQEKLRADALNTVATYEELLDVFQIALGPGLAAGLNVDEVRNVAVLVSQAASAIGVAQNQLSEEVRSLLTGNIRVTTSRIAQVLGLTNEDIRTATAAGDLYGLLTERLKGFSLASADAAKTVGGLFLRLKDVLGLITGRAAGGLFEDLRLTLQGVFDALTVREQTPFGDLLKPNPEVQAAFERIYLAIRRVLALIRQAGADIGTSGLQQFAEALAIAIEVIGRLGVAVISGLVRGLGLLSVAMAPVVAAFENLKALLDGAFGPGALDSILTGVTALLVTFVALNAIVSGTVGLIAKIGPQFLIASRAAGAVVGHLLNWRVALVAAVIGVNEVLKKVLGIEVTIADWPELIGTAVELMATRLLGNIESTVVRLKVAVIKAFKALVVDAEYYGKKIISFVDLVGGADTRQDLEVQRRNALKALIDEYKNLDLEVVEADQRDEQITKDAEARAAQRLNDLDEEIRRRTLLNEIPVPQLAAGGAPGEFDVTGLTQPPSQEDQRNLIVEQARVVAVQEQAKAAERIAELKAAQVDADQLALAQAQEELRILVAQSQARLAGLEAQRQELQERLQGERNEEGRNLILAQIRNVEAEITAEKRNQNAATIEQKERLRQLEQVINGTAGEGILEGAKKWGEQFASAFKAGIAIAEQALDAFARTVSQTIVDAFDPTKEVDIKERFARLMQEIAQIIIQQLVQLAIAKAIIGGATRTAGGFVSGGSPAGFHEGGSPRRASRWAKPSFQHYVRPRGHAAGGFPRPAGLDPRDTVPIWVDPREWIIRASSVRAYGADVMSKINAGLIDPRALKSLANSTRRAPAIRAPRTGFASGGPTAVASVPPPAASTTSTVVQPALVVNEATMEQIVNAGGATLKRFMREHFDEIGINSTRRN